MLGSSLQLGLQRVQVRCGARHSAAAGGLGVPGQRAAAQGQGRPRQARHLLQAVLQASGWHHGGLQRRAYDMIHCATHALLHTAV